MHIRDRYRYQVAVMVSQYDLIVLALSSAAVVHRYAALVHIYQVHPRSDTCVSVYTGDIDILYQVHSMSDTCVSVYSGDIYIRFRGYR